MKSIIKNVLREETKGYREKLKDIIEKQGIFSVVKILGGINNMKKVFMNDPEVSEILEDLTGVVDFTLYDHFKDRKPIVFTFRYEIIDVEENVWNTNSWPVINLIYDESKLTPQEKDQLMTILAVIINDNTEGKIITKFIKPIDNNYFYVRQINSKDVDIHDEEFPFSKEDVIRIHNKLYGESNNIQESKSNSALNFLKRRIHQVEIVKAINSSIKFVNGFRDREEMDGDTFERIVLDATMDEFHPILTDSGNRPFDYDGVHNALHQLFHDYIMDKYVEYNNENDILMEDITSRRTGEEFNELPKRDQMNVKLVYNYLVANHLILTEILKDYILHVDEDADEIAYMISKKNGEVHIDHNFKDKLLNLIKDVGWRDDLVEMASYLYLDKHLPKEIKFNSDQRLRGGHISIYRH